MTVLDPMQKYLRIDEHPETPTIKVAEGVTFVATANIGAEYTATRVIDRAILDRFQIVEVDTLDQEQEVGLLGIKFPDVNTEIVEAVAEIADHTRKMVKSDDPKISTIISTRQTVEMTSLIYDGFGLDEAAEVLEDFSLLIMGVVKFTGLSSIKPPAEDFPPCPQESSCRFAVVLLTNG